MSMRHYKLTAAIVLLLATNMVSFFLGLNTRNSEQTKDYEAACLQADFIHSLMDWNETLEGGLSVSSEIEESYYEWFQDLDCGIYKTKSLTDIKELLNYSWCY